MKKGNGDLIQEKYWTEEEAIRAARLHREAGVSVHIIESTDAPEQTGGNPVPCFFVEDGVPLIRTWERADRRAQGAKHGVFDHTASKEKEGLMQGHLLTTAQEVIAKFGTALGEDPELMSRFCKAVREQADYNAKRGKGLTERLLDKLDAVRRYAEGLLTLPNTRQTYSVAELLFFKEFGREILKILDTKED